MLAPCTAHASILRTLTFDHQHLKKMLITSTLFWHMGIISLVNSAFGFWLFTFLRKPCVYHIKHTFCKHCVFWRSKFTVNVWRMRESEVHHRFVLSRDPWPFREVFFITSGCLVRLFGTCLGWSHIGTPQTQDRVWSVWGLCGEWVNHGICHWVNSTWGC